MKSIKKILRSDNSSTADNNDYADDSNSLSNSQSPTSASSNSTNSGYRSGNRLSDNTGSTPGSSVAESDSGLSKTGVAQSGVGRTGTGTTSQNDTAVGRTGTGQSEIGEGKVGRAQKVVGQTGPFGDHHTRGHNNDETSLKGYNDPSTQKETTHLAPVTHVNETKDVIEEVQRERELTQHVHHLQHRVVPVADTVHQEEKHHHQVHQPTRVEEHHANTAEDAALFKELGIHKNEHHHMGERKTVVDLGETVHQKTQHHIHNVVQPVIEEERHDHHKVHTKIPVIHHAHEAPIVHESIVHQAISKADFLKGGGVLDSKISHNDGPGLYNEGCERQVDGPGEDIAQKLGLKGSDNMISKERPINP